LSSACVIALIFVGVFYHMLSKKDKVIEQKDRIIEKQNERQAESAEAQTIVLTEMKTLLTAILSKR